MKLDDLLSVRVFRLLSSSLFFPQCFHINNDIKNNKDEDNSPKTLSDKNHLINLLVMLLI